MTNSLSQSGIFGTLFQDRDIAEKFSRSHLLAQMIRFEIAWTKALGRVGHISEKDMQSAIVALAEFDVGGFQCASDTDGVPVPSLVAALRAQVGDSSAASIHTGATSQDVIDTALVMTYLEILDDLEARLGQTLAVLRDLDTRSGDAPIMARTRMQAALPATASLRIQSWIRPLQAQLKKLPRIREELAVVQIGGPIGLRNAPDGKGVEVAKEVAETLGLQVTEVWHAERSRMVELGNWFVLVTGALGKVGQDIALMAQQGLDEVELSGTGGSSAMPHKQNPILAETLVALARYVSGLQATLGQAMVHEQERSGAAWALEWLTLPAMAEATGAALRHGEDLAKNIVRIGTPN